jgi:hypothetical protein
MLDVVNNLSVLTGMIYGDASVSTHRCFQKKVNREYTLYKFQINHCAKQLSYLEYKKNLLGNIFQRDIQIKFKQVYLKTTKKYYDYCYIQIPIKEVKILREMFYPNNKKAYTIENLNNLNDLGVALWYMDDGTRSGMEQISICTFTTLEQAKIISEFFKERYSVDFRIARRSNYSINHQYYHSISDKQSKVNFVNIIKPYIIPDMEYKLLLD